MLPNLLLKCSTALLPAALLQRLHITGNPMIHHPIQKTLPPRRNRPRHRLRMPRLHLRIHRDPAGTPSNPQRYLTQLLTNLPATPISQLEQWLPDQWKSRNASPSG